MVLVPVGKSTTEILVNGSNEYGPIEQSGDSTYDVSVNTGISGYSSKVVTSTTSTTKSSQYSDLTSVVDYYSGSRNCEKIDYTVNLENNTGELLESEVTFYDDDAAHEVEYHDDNIVRYTKNANNFNEYYSGTISADDLVIRYDVEQDASATVDLEFYFDQPINESDVYTSISVSQV